MLLSSEWFSAQESEAMGLAWRVTPADDLLPETLRVAGHLAAKPIASLVEIKRTITAPHREAIAAARARADKAFARLLGRPANMEAFVALAERRPPDFVAVDVAHPVSVAEHWAD
jgi:enoyl-CoA hydratase/carnithine racemase